MVTTPPPVAILGGSIIGLSCAVLLARRGVPVRILAPQQPPTDAAAWVAGGMFGAYTEAWPGEERALEFSREALAAWERMLPLLQPHAPRPLVTATGVLLVGVDASDAAEIAVVCDTVARVAPGTVTPVSRAELREREPALARGLRAAAWCPAEHSVDNRAVLHALRAAATAAGVRWETAAPATPAELSALVEPEERVIIATGASAGTFLDLAIRPVKGEVVRLRRRPGVEPAPRYTIRGRVHGRPLYLVPRHDGLAVGATEYEHGLDRDVTVGGVQQLLADAERLFPGITEYHFHEVRAGLRPYSPDNLPAIGPADTLARARYGAGVFAACGHGRNGIVWAALTAELLTAAICEGQPCPPAVSPGRWG